MASLLPIWQRGSCNEGCCKRLAQFSMLHIALCVLQSAAQNSRQREEGCLIEGAQMAAGFTGSSESAAANLFSLERNPAPHDLQLHHTDAVDAGEVHESINDKQAAKTRHISKVSGRLMHYDCCSKGSANNRKSQEH